MGSLRLILAISVVLSHTYGYLFVGGRLAVQMFYIISGFTLFFTLILSHVMVVKIINPIEKIRIKNKINNTKNI